MLGLRVSAEEKLVSRLAAAAERWLLTDVTPVAETVTSSVNRASTVRGIHALKLLKPYGRDELCGAKLMEWWAGEGAARINAIEGDDILMEWIEGAPLGDSVRKDARFDLRAAEAISDIVSSLHRHRADAPPPLPSLRSRFDTLLNADLSFLPTHAEETWRRTKELTEALLQGGEERELALHGDLHHDNIIGSPNNWRAIDAKGLIGDPSYEVANVFRNPYGLGDLAAEKARVNLFADLFSGRLGLSRRRILCWAAVHSAISAVWDHHAGNSFEFDLKMAPVLVEAVDTMTSQFTGAPTKLDRHS